MNTPPPTAPTPPDDATRVCESPDGAYYEPEAGDSCPAGHVEHLVPPEPEPPPAPAPAPGNSPVSESSSE